MDPEPVDQRFAQINEAQQRFDRNQNPSPKIQRVPIFLRQNDRFAKYCSPKMISFGPIHHANESLKQQGERYKLLWTSKFVAEYGRKINQDANLAAQLLHNKVEDNIEELKNLFTEDAIGSYDDSELAWMLFVDGCSLLHFMENVDNQNPGALNLKLGQLMHMWRDIELLENQLPRKLLEILCTEKEIDLPYLFSNFMDMGRSKRCGKVDVLSENLEPFHILDSVRSLYLSSDSNRKIDRDNHVEVQSEGNENNQMGKDPVLDQQDDNEDEDSPQVLTYKNIRDLKTAGIKVMRNKTDVWSWNNISFTPKCFSGELRLPIFVFNDVTPYFFRNLIAYEMCPDVPYDYECCSFFSFMDSLIDNAEDVKELRLAGIFENLLGSDEDLARLFNELGDDLPTKMYSNILCTDAVAYSKKYNHVKLQIEKHYANKWRTWLAQAYNTHFNTPWAMIAFLAASLALVLTSIQTWFAINPKSPN